MHTRIDTDINTYACTRTCTHTHMPAPSSSTVSPAKLLRRLFSAWSIRTRTHAHTHIHRQKCARTHTHTRTHTHMSTQFEDDSACKLAASFHPPADIYTHRHRHTHKHTHTHMHADANTDTRVYQIRGWWRRQTCFIAFPSPAGTHTHTHTFTHTHTLTHTHTTT